MDNFTAPYYVPNTPPRVAASNHLVTTISSGAGTTMLTLANPASTTVSGATILLDSAGFDFGMSQLRLNPTKQDLIAGHGNVVAIFIDFSTAFRRCLRINVHPEEGSMFWWILAAVVLIVSFLLIAVFFWASQDPAIDREIAKDRFRAEQESRALRRSGKSD